MSLSNFLISCVIAAVAVFVCVSATAEKNRVPPPQEHTQAAFDLWAKGCKPDDFHYGVTEDEHGTRAFIVTCSPVGRPL